MATEWTAGVGGPEHPPARVYPYSPRRGATNRRSEASEGAGRLSCQNALNALNIPMPKGCVGAITTRPDRAKTEHIAIAPPGLVSVTLTPSPVKRPLTTPSVGVAGRRRSKSATSDAERNRAGIVSTPPAGLRKIETNPGMLAQKSGSKRKDGSGKLMTESVNGMGLGKRQRRTLIDMMESGGGRWPQGWQVSSTSRDVVTGLAIRGLITGQGADAALTEKGERVAAILCGDPLDSLGVLYDLSRGQPSRKPYRSLSL